MKIVEKIARIYFLTIFALLSLFAIYEVIIILFLIGFTTYYIGNLIGDILVVILSISAVINYCQKEMIKSYTQGLFVGSIFLIQFSNTIGYASDILSISGVIISALFVIFSYYLIINLNKNLDNPQD